MPANEDAMKETILHIFENRNIKGNTKDQILALNDIIRFINVNLQDCQYATDQEWEAALESINITTKRQASLAVKTSRQMASQVSRYPDEQKH